MKRTTGILLRYPARLQMLELELVQSTASEAQSLGADARPLTLALTASISECSS